MADPEAGAEVTGEHQDLSGVGPEARAMNEALKQRGERLRAANAEMEAGFGAAYEGAGEVLLDDYDLPKDVPEDGDWHRFGSGAQEGNAGLVAVTVSEAGRTEELVTRHGSSLHYIYEHTLAGSDDMISATILVGTRDNASVAADGTLTEMPWSETREPNHEQSHNYIADEEEDAKIRSWLAQRLKRQAEANFGHVERRPNAA